MKAYLKSKEDVVQYVKEVLLPLSKGSALTMTITTGASEGFFVNTVIEESLVGIATHWVQSYLKRLTSTS